MTGPFTAAASALAEAVSITPTQARGTLRLLLKDKGLDPRVADKAVLDEVVGSSLQQALFRRKLPYDDAVVQKVRDAIAGAEEGVADGSLAGYELFRDLD